MDGVPNEVLKHMPKVFHDNVHALFVYLWEQRVTPKQWKTALTILLYKKDDPRQVKNHRPIGLLNTIYKLWTTIVTKCLAMFVEQNNLLSDSQEGFRPNRNTTRQLQRLVMAMEDASMTDHPIYVLYVDFVNAFGSVDHARMAEILRVQGYPEDIVDIIRDLYTDANTVVRTPVGDTDTIPNMGRGTVQGDPLSPLLFIIAIDPLLRWLEKGNRGYKMQTCNEVIHSLAYADDLAVLASNMGDLHAQARKIQAYCKWAGFEVNVNTVRKDKTAWTGPTSRRPDEQHLQLMGKEIPRLKPHESYVYLGVHINLNLSWAKHMGVLKKKVREKTMVIKHMKHTPTLVMRTLEMVVRPMIRYSIPIGIMRSGDIATLNSMFWTTAKHIVGLSTRTSKWNV